MLLAALYVLSSLSGRLATISLNTHTQVLMQGLIFLGHRNSLSSEVLQQWIGANTWGITLFCTVCLPVISALSPLLHYKLAGIPKALKRLLANSVSQPRTSPFFIASEPTDGCNFPASYPGWAQRFENIQKDAFRKLVGLSGPAIKPQLAYYLFFLSTTA